MIIVLSNVIYTRDSIMPGLNHLYKITASPKTSALHEVCCCRPRHALTPRQKCMERFQELDQRTFSSYVSQTGAVFAQLVRRRWSCHARSCAADMQQRH